MLLKEWFLIRNPSKFIAFGKSHLLADWTAKKTNKKELFVNKATNDVKCKHNQKQQSKVPILMLIHKQIKQCIYHAGMYLLFMNQNYWATRVKKLMRPNVSDGQTQLS